MAKRVIIRPHVQLLTPDASTFPATDAAAADFKNLTQFCKGFELSEEVAQVDVTTSANKGYSAMSGALETFSATITFLQDFEATRLHDQLSALKNARAEGLWFVRPNAGSAISADNRLAIFRGVIANYSPFTAAIGSALEVTAEISPGPNNTGVAYYSTEVLVQAVDGLANYDEATQA